MLYKNKQLKRFFLVPGWCVITLLLFVALPLSALASSPDQAHSISSSEEGFQKKIHEQLKRVVISKLKFYANQFPDINFIILDSAADTKKNMQILVKILGKNAVPLDYAHPEDVRDTLLSATLDRIEYLLSENAGSSTLFRPGKEAIAKRKALCVITMNPWLIARNNKDATHHLLEVPENEFDSLLPEKYLDHISHLKFVIDHESYHCLDSYYNGPMPRSQLKEWSGYNIRKNELGADAFASIMNVSSQGGVTPYIDTLHNIRALTILTGDYDHYTYDVAKAVRQLDVSALQKSDVKDYFRIATEIRNKLNGSYDDYVRYRREADVVRMKLTGQNKKDNLYLDAGENKQVKIMLDDTQHAYKELFGHNIKTEK